MTPTPRRTASYFEDLVAKGLDPGAKVAFLYKEERLEISVEILLRGASPGWLLSAVDAAAEASLEPLASFVVPEETPLPPGLAPAFWRLLHLLNQEVPIAEGFASQFHLLPSAFLASHLLGLERCVVELRGAVLRSPMAMLRALRKTDGQVFLRAMDLGFTRCAQPKRPGVAETLDAAEALLRTSGTKAAARVLGAAMEAQPEKLFHFFHAAQLLRKDSQLLRLAATHPGALYDGLSRLVTLTSHEATLRSALDGELDCEAPERIIHVAASIGNMQVLRLALQAGQHVNSFSAKGETPAMLAAAAGHAETLRYLLRNQADVARKSRAGFTALEYAARNGHPEVVRLLRDPFSRLA